MTCQIKVLWLLHWIKWSATIFTTVTPVCTVFSHVLWHRRSTQRLLQLQDRQLFQSYSFPFGPWFCPHIDNTTMNFFWGSRLVGDICNPLAYTPTQFWHRLPRCGNFSRAIIDVFHFPTPPGQTRDISSFINNWVIGWSLRQCQSAAARPWMISGYPERLWWESVRDTHHLLIRGF